MGGCVHPERERGEFLMADYLTTDTDLTTVADAIREKGGTSAALEWPSGFAQAIADIPSGGAVGTAHVYVGALSAGTYTASDGTLKQSVLDPNTGVQVIDDDAILNSLIFFRGNNGAMLPTGGTGVTEKFRATFTRPAGAYVVYQVTG